MHECPEVAVVCLTASANPREIEALLRGGRDRLPAKDQELDEIVGAIRRAGEARAPREPDRREHGDRARLDRRLPRRPERFPNWRVVPLYVRFGEESFRDYVELDPHEFYARLRTATELPTTSQPTPRTSSPPTRSSRGYERISRCTSRRSSPARSRAPSLAATELERRPDARSIDTESASVAIAMLALAIQRRLERGHDRRGDRRARRALPRAHGAPLHRRHARVPRAGRPHRPRQGVAGQLLNVKPILAIEDGEVVPVKRVRGSAKAFQEFARRVRGGDDATSPGLRGRRSRTRTRRTRSSSCEKMVRAEPAAGADRDRRRRLGAVVGTHAGPGTVGFFWFHDRASRSGCDTRAIEPAPSPVSPAVDPPERWPPTRGRFRGRSGSRRRSTRCPGVGPTLKKRLAKLGLEHVGDLLDHRPRRYEQPGAGAPDRRPLRRRGGA